MSRHTPVHTWRWVVALALMLSMVGGTVIAQDAATPSDQTVNIEIIVDQSGSMGAQTDTGVLRMISARTMLNEVIDQLPTDGNVNVGLRVYGHLGSNNEADMAVSCASTELMVPVDGVNTDALHGAVENLYPVGYTPIALALQEAQADFPEATDGTRNVIILVTDGLETCGGDPASVAGELAASPQSITTNVVGFGTTEEEQAILQGIATNGNGELIGAQNTSQLMDSVFTLLEGEGVVSESGQGQFSTEPISVGRSGESGTFTLNVIDAEPEASEWVLSQNPDAAPEEGMAFTTATVTVTNNSDQATTTDQLEFSLVAPDGTSYPAQDQSCGVAPTSSTGTTELQPGESAEVTYCWQIPADQSDDVVLAAAPVDDETAPALWFSVGNPVPEDAEPIVFENRPLPATEVVTVEPTATTEPTATEVPPTETPEPTATTEPTATDVPPTETPEPTATATPEPTATEVPPTETPEPTATATPEPTATEVPPTGTPEPTATATPEPTATEVPPTETPEPTATATPEPTATEVPPTETPEPTATATPEPTATATPEPTATATPEPTATPTQEPVVVPIESATPQPATPTVATPVATPALIEPDASPYATADIEGMLPATPVSTPVEGEVVPATPVSTPMEAPTEIVPAVDATPEATPDATPEDMDTVMGTPAETVVPATPVSTPMEVPTEVVSTEATPAASPAIATVVNAADSSREAPVAPGDAVQVGDYDITVVDYTTDATDQAPNAEPADGQQIVMVRVAVTNNSETASDPATDLMFGASGASTTISPANEIVCGEYVESFVTTGELQPGETREMNICVTIPTDDAGSLMLMVADRINLGADPGWLTLED